MKLSWKTCFKVCVSIFLLYLCIHHWPMAFDLVAKLFSAALPLLLGCGIAYVLNLLMSFYERHYFPKTKKKWLIKSRRPVSLTAALVTLIAIVALVFVTVLPQLIECIRLLLSELPEWMALLIAFIEKHDLLSEDVLATLSAVDWKSQIGKIIEVVTSGIGNVVELVMATVTSVMTVTVTALLAVIFSVYLLCTKEQLGRQFNRLMDTYLPKETCRKIRTVVKTMNECFHNYIVGQCTEAVILGVLCILGMLLFRLPYATMVGTLVGFTALIPVAGAYIGAAVGAFMILTVSPAKALVFLIFILVLQQLEGNIIYPRVVGQSIGLPAIWVLAAVTVGGGLFGVVGMLLGVPLAATAWKLMGKDMKAREG